MCELFFGVKLDYIVILEKFCNSSTLLMELFMICGHLGYFEMCQLLNALLFFETQ